MFWIILLPSDHLFLGAVCLAGSVPGNFLIV